MAWLPAAPAQSPTSYEVVELLVSGVPEDRAKGQDLLERHGQVIFADLLTRLQSKNQQTVGTAAFELGLAISPWLRAKDQGSRFMEFTSIHAVARPIERPASIPDAATYRRALQDAYDRLRSESALRPQQAFQWRESMAAVVSTLEEVADDGTIDWALAQLQHVNSPHLAEPLVRTCHSYCGLPFSYQAGGLCGNSTANEVQQFQIKEAAALVRAVAEFTAAWKTIKPKTLEARISHALPIWRDMIITQMRRSSGSYSRRSWLDEEFSPLLRFGTAALPALRVQRDCETELGEKAVWEYFLAGITGEPDAAIVGPLLQGSDPQRDWACEIIAASGSTRWSAQLENLKLVNGYHNGKASQVLAACHGPVAIPALERLHQHYPEESHTRYALQELKARAEKGPLKRRHWRP